MKSILLTAVSIAALCQSAYAAGADADKEKVDTDKSSLVLVAPKASDDGSTDKGPGASLYAPVVHLPVSGDGASGAGGGGAGGPFEPSLLSASVAGLSLDDGKDDEGEGDALHHEPEPYILPNAGKAPAKKAEEPDSDDEAGATGVSSLLASVGTAPASASPSTGAGAVTVDEPPLDVLPMSPSALARQTSVGGAGGAGDAAPSKAKEAE